MIISASSQFQFKASGLRRLSPGKTWRFMHISVKHWPGLKWQWQWQ